MNLKLYPELERLWVEHLALQFQNNRKRDRFNVSGGELTEYDGFLAGIISSTLHGTRVKKEEWLKEDIDFENRLASLKPEDSPDYELWLGINEYYDRLNQMMSVVREIYKEGF